MHSIDLGYFVLVGRNFFVFCYETLHHLPRASLGISIVAIRYLSVDEGIMTVGFKEDRIGCRGSISHAPIE
jgi:hypothetical protein